MTIDILEQRIAFAHQRVNALAKFYTPGHDQLTHGRRKGLSGGLSAKELIKTAFEAGVKLFGTPRTKEEKILRDDLFMAGKNVPSNLIGSGLIFNKNASIIKTTLASLVADFNAQFDDQDRRELPPDVLEPKFSTFDYVFFPLSKKSPIDVADTISLADPQVYDKDGKSYFYSGEADAILIMDRGSKDFTEEIDDDFYELVARIDALNERLVEFTPGHDQKIHGRRKKESGILSPANLPIAGLGREDMKQRRQEIEDHLVEKLGHPLTPGQKKIIRGDIVRDRAMDKRTALRRIVGTVRQGPAETQFSPRPNFKPNLGFLKEIDDFITEVDKPNFKGRRDSFELLLRLRKRIAGK